MFTYSDDALDWSNYNNRELWVIFKKGDQNAFSELFSRFYHRLFRYGMSLVSDSNAVKDGIQELFLSLWRSRTDLAEAKSVEFYLLVALKRILLRERRKNANRNRVNLEYIKGFAYADFGAENYLIELESDEERYILYQKAIQSLTDRQREVMMLRMEYGLDNIEIAEILELSEKSVRNLIYEATRKMRARIANLVSFEINLN